MARWCSGLFYVGGNWGNDSNAGVSYFNNNSLDYSNTNYGARLDYVPGFMKFKTYRTTPLGEIENKILNRVSSVQCESPELKRKVVSAW